jgi:hypothetical protein
MITNTKPTNKAQSFASYVQQTKNNTSENKGMALASKLKENKEQERLALKRKLEEKREAEEGIRTKMDLDKFVFDLSMQNTYRDFVEIENINNRLDQSMYDLYKKTKSRSESTSEYKMSKSLLDPETAEKVEKYEYLEYRRKIEEKLFQEHVNKIDDAIWNDPDVIPNYSRGGIGDQLFLGDVYDIVVEKSHFMDEQRDLLNEYYRNPPRTQGEYEARMARRKLDAALSHYLLNGEIKKIEIPIKIPARNEINELSNISNDSTKAITARAREEIVKRPLLFTTNYDALPTQFELAAASLTSKYMGEDQYIEINGDVFTRNEMKAYLYNQIAEASHLHLLQTSPKYLEYIYEQETGQSYEDAMRDRVEELKSIIIEMRNEAGNEEYWTTKQEEFARGKEMGHFDFVASFVSERIADGARVGAEKPYDDILEKINAWEENDFRSSFSEAFDWSSFFSLGLIDLANSNTMNIALEKYYNGKALSSQEKRLVKVAQLEQELESYKVRLYDTPSTWANIGSGVGSTVDMAPSFFLAMTGVGSIGAGIKFGSKAAVKTYIKHMTFKTGAKMAGTLLWDATKLTGVSYARGLTAAAAMPSTYTNYLKDVNSQYSFDENGELVFKPKDKTKMFLGAVIDNANEIASEFVGGTFGDVISLGSKAFGRATGISKALNKSKAGTWLRKTAQAPMSNSMKKFIRNAGYSGIISEPLSEVYGDFMSQVMRKGIGAEYDFEHFKDPDYWITTMGVSTIYGGALTTLGAGKNIVKEANYAKKLVKTNNELLGDISNEDLKNTLKLLGNSENFINSAIELSKYDWEGKCISPADKARAIKYMRNSYALQTTMGDIEGQRHMHTFGAVMDELHSREYIQDGKSSEKLVYAIDKKGNIYNILEGNYKDENSKVKVKNNKGEVTEISNSELIHLGEESIGDSMAREYHNMFSVENESFRLNAVRQTFEEISNPTKEDVKRVISEFGIEKLEVGDDVTLVDGTEATIQEDLKNGKYKIERYDPISVIKSPYMLEFLGLDIGLLNAEPVLS